MAEEDVISAMWCSLVPTIQYQLDEGAQPNTEMTETEADNYNYAESEAETSVDVEALSNYIEARVLHLPPQHILPNINYWNHWDHMPHTYPVTEHIDHYVQDQDAAPINYILKEQEITQAYSKAETETSVVDTHTEALSSYIGARVLHQYPPQGQDIVAMNNWNQREMSHPKAEHSYHPHDEDLEPVNYWDGVEMVQDYSQTDEEFLTDVETILYIEAISNSLEAKHNLQRPQGQSDNYHKKIYRVPEVMRKTNANFYDPQFISLGPYHYSDSGDHRHLQSAKNHKDLYLKKLYGLNKNVSHKNYLQKIWKEEQQIRNYYEDIKPKGDKLADSLLLDACCIMGFSGVLKYCEEEKEKNKKKDKKDHKKKEETKKEADARPIFISPEIDIDSIPLWGMGYLVHDIILLENQIPVFVMKIIYELVMGKSDDDGGIKSLRSQIADYIHNMLKYSYAISAHKDRKSVTEEFQYILHYCHMYFKPTITSSDTKQEERGKSLDRWHSATDLYEAGVKFKKFKGDNRSLLDVSFDNKELQIPTLVIDGNTGSLFRNIIIFEQSSSRYESSTNPNYKPSDSHNNYFAAYVKFMADLMTTTEDVALLARKGIIVNHGKHEDLLVLFSDLMSGVGFKSDEDNYLTPLYRSLEEHYKSRPHKWMADLKHKYCQTPWLIIGVIATILIFGFTTMGAVLNLRDHINSSK